MRVLNGQHQLCFSYILFLLLLFFFLHSKCKSCGQKTVKVPLFGKTTVMSLLVLLFCVAFATFWVWTRKESYAWVGQDILVSYFHKFYIVFCFHVFLDGSCATIFLVILLHCASFGWVIFRNLMNFTVIMLISFWYG